MTIFTETCSGFAFLWLTFSFWRARTPSLTLPWCINLWSQNMVCLFIVIVVTPFWPEGQGRRKQYRIFLHVRDLKESTGVGGNWLKTLVFLMGKSAIIDSMTVSLLMDDERTYFDSMLNVILLSIQWLNSSVQVLISAPIQFFFAWRIQKITQSYWIPAIVVALALASTGGLQCHGFRGVIIPWRFQREDSSPVLKLPSWSYLH